MRGFIAAGIAVTLMVGTLQIARADEASNTDQIVNHQADAWTTATMHARHRWLPVNWEASHDPNAPSPFQPIVVHANGAVSVVFSATVVGGPVEFRVRDGQRVMHPGPARFVPGSGLDSVSYTFADNGGNPACGRDIVVEWRLAAAAPTTLRRGSVLVTYKKDTADHGQVGCA